MAMAVHPAVLWGTPAFILAGFCCEAPVRHWHLLPGMCLWAGCTCQPAALGKDSSKKGSTVGSGRNFPSGRNLQQAWKRQRYPTLAKAGATEWHATHFDAAVAGLAPVPKAKI